MTRVTATTFHKTTVMTGLPHNGALSFVYRPANIVYLEQPADLMVKNMALLW